MACGVVYIFWVNKAIHGCDPVAYFTKGKPVRVENDYSLNWNGARWLFAGTANRDKFKVFLKKFMPQYGGYCAWAASLGVRGFKRSRCLEDFRRQALYVRTRMCLVPVVSLWSR